MSIQHLELLFALQRQPRRAARLLGYVDEQFNQMGYSRECTERWGYTKLMGVLREGLSDDEIEALAAEGAAWSEDRAVEEALTWA